MRTSLFSLLITSPPAFGYDAPWLKEADELARAAEEAERQTYEADPPKEGGVYSARPNHIPQAGRMRPL